jgi:hypothetical protein
VTLTQDVEITGTVVTDDTVTAPFSGSKTITIESGGTLDLGITPATVTSIGATIVNKGEIETATTAASVLGTILGAKGKITATGAITALDAALSIPADVELTLKAASATFAGTQTITVAGTLNIDSTSALLTFAGATITTSGTGVINSATATAIVLQGLLASAGSALKIEQTGAVELSAATTVKADTTLTIKGSGSITATSGTAALTVTGKVILEGTGAIATAGTDDSGGDIIITDDGSITAGGIVISGAGNINTDKANPSFLTVDKLTLIDANTIVITGSQIQAGGATGITFKAGSYVFGNVGAVLIIDTDDVPTLTLPDTADSLAIGNDVASEMVFGANSVYKAGGSNTTITPGVGTTAKTDVKLTFTTGAKIISGTGASTVTTGVGLKVDGAVNADDTTYTVGTTKTVTKSANTKAWTETVDV